MNTQHSGRNAFDGFAERVAQAGVILTQSQIETAAEWERKTGCKVSLEPVIKRQQGIRTLAINQANSLRQEAAQQFQARLAETQRLSALHRHNVHTQNRLTAATNALARQLRQCSGR